MERLLGLTQTFSNLLGLCGFYDSARTSRSSLSVFVHYTKRLIVPAYPKIVKVPEQLAAQPFMLIFYFIVAMSTTPLPQLFHEARPSLTNGFLLQYPVTIS